MTLKFVAVAVLLASAVLLAALRLGHERRPVEERALTAVASFYPLSFFAQQIAGDNADVVDLTPPGSEPHDYEPTARDMARMERAKLLIVNGRGFEPWRDNIAANIDPRHTRIVAAGEGLAASYKGGDGDTARDPHVWLAPALAAAMANTIAQAFEEVDPDRAAAYESNAGALEAKLRDLDAAYRKGLAHCSEHDLVVSHAAFGYLAAAYHLHQIPIAGLSPDAEPSARQLAGIANLVKKSRVRVIFFERLVSPKLSETLAAEAGARTMVLDPIEGLTRDDLAAGKTYFTEMRQNLANLEAALACPSTIQ